MKKILLGLLVVVFALALSGCGSSKAEAPIDVYKQFAKNVNNQNYAKALELMTPELRGSYSGNDNAPLKNIKSMAIKKTTKKTDEWDVDASIGKNYKYEVYYVKVYYRIYNTSPSYFKDKSNYHHKVIVVKATKDSDWKIAETSGAPGMN